MSASGNEIGDLLVDIGIITAEELASAMEEQARSGDRLTLILDRLGLVTYHQLKDSLELQYGVNFFSLSKNPPEKEIADLVSLEIKTKYKLIPVANSGTQYTIAMVNPDDLIAVDALRVELRSGHIKQLVCTADEFEFCMKNLYEPTAAPAIDDIVPQAADLSIDSDAKSDFKQAESLSEEFTLPASVIAQANALEKKASPRVPAKKHLQSLFGDDDDDDIDSSVAPASPAPMEPILEQVRVIQEVQVPQELQVVEVAAIASDSDVPVETLIVAALLGDAATPETPVEVSLEAPVENFVEVLVEPIADRAPALVAAVKETELAPPVAPPQISPVVSLVDSTQGVPSLSSVLERVVDQVVGEIATAAQSAPITQALPILDPLPASEPVSVSEPIPTSEPISAALSSVDQAAVTALKQVAQAESALQAAVTNVTNQLVESSMGALNANANRQLLEDVVESELGGSEEETDIHRMKEAQNASVMLLAHEIIGKATQKRCSDIHLEPDASGVSLRYFLHGELLADCMLPLEIHGALVGSYKVIAGLNPQELVKPQDKKFTTKVEEDEVELRITTIPTDNGEMVAISMRFTDPNSAGAIAQAKLASMSED
ncbi:hypothetical protein BH11CYA1_BH11CYA1_29360 [soil metagenome]